MKTFLFSLLAILIAPAIAQAGLAGSLVGLDPTTYNEQWRVSASNSYLILDKILGGSDLTYTEMVGFGTDGNGSYCDLHIGDNPGATERIYLGDVHDISGVYVGAKSINATATRCLWAYNFDDLSFLGETTPSEVIIDDQDICSETDGGYAPYAVGTMNHNFPNLSSPITDFCVNDSQLNEYCCDSSLLDGSHTAVVDCDYGCVGGRCLYDYEIEPEEICEESDGGYAPYAFGTITHNFQNFSSPSDDYCINDDRVNEYYCDSNLLDGTHTDEFTCPYGCLDGRCLYDYEVEQEEDQPSPPPPPAPNPDSCSDTDGGHEIYEKGTITSVQNNNTVIAEDHCSAATGELGEYSCDGTSANLEYIECETSCDDGVCVQPEEEQEEEKGPLKMFFVRFAEIISVPFEWLWSLFRGN